MFPTTGRREGDRRIRTYVTIVRARDIGPISAKMIRRRGGGVVGVGTGKGGAVVGGVIGKKGGVIVAVRAAVVLIPKVLAVKGFNIYI